MPLQQFITIANSAPQQPPSPATMSSSPKRVVTTTSKSPLSWTTALRIPTVQPKTLFKFTTVTTASTTKTACRVPCRQEPHDIQPLFSEKTCGLFNTVESTVTPEIDKFDLDMDEANINFEPFLTNFDFNSVVEQSSPLNQSSTPSSSQLTLQSSPITAAAIPVAAATAAASNTIIPKKTFHQKLNEANLSIKIVKPNIDNITVAAATAASAAAQMTSNNTTLEGMMSPSFGFDYDNAEMSKLFTPGTEKLCFDLIDSIATSDILDPVLEEEEEPSASSPPDVLSLLKQQQSVASARVATEEELIACLGIDACDLQTMIADSTSPPVVAAPVVAPATVATSSIAAPLAAFTPLPPPPPAAPQHADHAYSSSRTVAEKRRRLSSTASAFDEFAAPPSSVLSTTSTNLDTSDEMNSSMTMPSTSGIAGGKRQRTKGVYRARDVTNESEMQNYRERRQKNNISSKISRANKRNFYLEMDAKCEHVENENKKFTRKIAKLELLNQLMKEYLKKAFSANLK